MAKKLSNLTSPKAVQDAIDECDRLGREAFRKKYGFGQSRKYVLRVGDSHYDSKAIVGVAYGKQHGTPLRSREFTGGEHTVVPVLRRLGFDAFARTHPAESLSIGAVYSRTDLLRKFGGQIQSGIWTPREFPVVFAFTGKSGVQYGYEDGWTEDGVFKYTGEGQLGDMTFKGGNKAIRDHRDEGEDILLFSDLGKGKGVRYTGVFECADWETRSGTDKQGNSRKIIVFSLVPVITRTEPSSLYRSIEPGEDKTLNELREAAYDASNRSRDAVPRRSVKANWQARSEAVRQYVLARAKGICELCEQPAPFNRKSDGTPYLEPHHTRRLADDGPDHPMWVGAVCPTCHRRIHSGEDGQKLNAKLKIQLRKIEGTD